MTEQGHPSHPQAERVSCRRDLVVKIDTLFTWGKVTIRGCWKRLGRKDAAWTQVENREHTQFISRWLCIWKAICPLSHERSSRNTQLLWQRCLVTFRALLPMVSNIPCALEDICSAFLWRTVFCQMGPVNDTVWFSYILTDFLSSAHRDVEEPTMLNFSRVLPPLLHVF